MITVSVKNEIEKLASHLLCIGGQSEPPVKLSYLFAPRRILGARPSRSLETDGSLCVDKGGFTILYRSSYKVREHFTIAHEIGHTFFYNIETSPPTRLYPSPFPVADEEEICNLIASELLMPHQSVLRAIERLDSQGKREPRPEILISIAGTFFVSVSTMARRLVQELDIWNAIVLSAVWLPKIPDKKQTNSPTWRAIWGYAPPRYKTELFLPPFKKLPRVRFAAAQDAFQRFLQHKPTHAGPYLEPLARFSLGNLVKFLRKRVPESNEYPVYAICYAKERPRLFNDSYVPLSTEVDEARKPYQVLLCIPLPSTSS